MCKEKSRLEGGTILFPNFYLIMFDWIVGLISHGLKILDYFKKDLHL